MEQGFEGFEGFVRNRFTIESSDLPDIASHIDPTCFEADWSLPAHVDELFDWLTFQPDTAMDAVEQIQAYQPNTSAQPSPAAADPAVGEGPATVGPSQRFPAGQLHAGPAQHHVSEWQLTYLQQAVQQEQQTPDIGHSAQQQQQQNFMDVLYPAQQQQQQLTDMLLSAQQQQQSTGDLHLIQQQQSTGVLLPGQQQHQQQQVLFPCSMTSAAAFPATGQDSFLQSHASTAAASAWQPPYQYAEPAAAAAGDAKSLANTGSGYSNVSRNSNSSGSSAKQQQQHSSKPSGRRQAASTISKGTAGHPASSRKPRKVTDAQRAAHKRFRTRRKEQVSAGASARI